ncbi:hypothetical protein V3C99_017135 [Haemonchus contortus]|uniref:Uncharacterized protein n=1 Tax=Haemonchus contortus TaxID=6289 RepID=A0A7I4Z7P9_HAECO
MECAFTVTEKKSDIATVLPQRNFATCSLTINLSRLTLEDDAVSITDKCSVPPLSKNAGISGEKIAQRHGTTEGIPIEPSDAKENVTIQVDTVVSEEKSVEEPALKRRRNHPYPED